MAYLTLDAQPPPSKTIGGTYTHKDVMNETISTPEKVLTEGPHPTTDSLAEDSPMNAYPVVRLDVDTISDAVASRLATSLLGHVLFLKNQVPFPVMQLGRIPGGKVNSRAFKQRTELLASYDTISSHLDTTFSALSTALARCAHSSSAKVAQAHVAILVGPSLGTAKSRVILGIDGLQTRIWGTREGTVSENAEAAQDSDEEEQEEEEESSSADESDSSAEEPEGSDEEEDDNEGEDDESQDEDKYDAVPATSPPPPPPLPLPPHISYAEEQKFLQSADRLLSRTLAAADAEGNGISSEMSPTQTHILLRAPRRFVHPAWIPRQNVTAALDNTLQNFMTHSGLKTVDSNSPPRHNHSSKKMKVEGVWITGRSGIQRTSVIETDSSEQIEERLQDDDNEMIWWSWDGKFVGFSDW